MATYWISFRIHEDKTYAERYNALTQAITETAQQNNWWSETTSFYIISSDLTMSALAARLKVEIAPSKDLIVIGNPDYKSGHVIGNCMDDDIFKLIPFMKKV